ncbi:MAG TPA: restriction endonuclease [Actinopolymorphaceae bacterium]|jgi:restriction system protein
MAGRSYDPVARRQRELLQEQRAREQAKKRAAAEKRKAEQEAKQRHIARRTAEAEQRTRGVEHRVKALNSILSDGLRRSAKLSFEDMKRVYIEPPLDLGHLAEPPPKPRWEDFEPAPPGLLKSIFGGIRRYEEEKARRERDFQQATQAWEKAEAERQRKVVAMRRRHSEEVARARAETESYNRLIAAEEEGFKARERNAVENYARRVLKAMPRPAGFPYAADVTYSGPPQELLLVQFELPQADVVPAAREYKYVRARDEIKEYPRPKKEFDELYRSVISQLTLLCIRDLFDADPSLQRVGFNGHVTAIDPATGKREYPCLISVVVDRAEFADLVLDQVKPEACLKRLQAIITHHPYALEGVQPVLDFELTKFSFVEGLDAVSSLDSRPDLLDMSPENFEHLIRQVFEAYPEFEGWTTTRSNDDGVDGVVINKTALVGGLAVVQAKRYRAVIGPSHIRELVGTMDEKRAGKGILVTTSWFTAKAEAKARENGRVELIDGPRLVYLIKQNLGKDVMIGLNFPDRVLKNRDS